MDKCERLLNLLALLLNSKKPHTVTEIGQLIEGYPEDGASFRRAFERDKDELRSIGVPISVVPLPGDSTESGYIINDDEFYLDDPGLTEAELSVLRLAAGVIRLGTTVDTTTFRKLGGVPKPVPGAVSSLIDINGAEIIGALFEAISLSSEVSFDYRSTARSVAPLRIEYAIGNWYLQAFDLVSSSLRNYRIDRFESVPKIGETVDVDAPPLGPIVAQPWTYGADDPFDATLGLTNPDRELLRRLGLSEVTETVTIAVTSQSGLIDFVVENHPTVTLLSPQSSIDTLIAHIGGVTP